ncbi:MAG TPA: hypothetical protein VEJ63_23175 [Planctomycetota bacterium]|nr:hypothetical protein [Planctomycetota bacterium]
MSSRLAPLALALLLGAACASGAEEGIKVGDAAPALEGKTWVAKDNKAPDVKGKVHIIEFYFAG